MTPLALRSGTPADVEALAALAMAAWPDESFDPAHIARVMAEADHRTIVATDDPALVGFTDCFATRTAAGARRWEIDLLAVHPAHQGQGIGRRLVAAGTDAGIAAGAHYARALIAHDNRASQRAFAACGFAPVDIPHALYLTERADTRAQAFARAWHRVPAVTFRYAGWWLEPRAPSTEMGATTIASDIAPGDLAGILLPTDAAPLIDSAIAAGFARAGTFHFWERQIGGIY